MAQSGYTPISHYYSTTASAAPTAGNLINGELAMNITDGKLFYKNNAGSVSLLATDYTVSGTANGVAYLNGSKVLTTGSALTFDGTTLTSTGGSVYLNGTSSDSAMTGNYVRFSTNIGLQSNAANNALVAKMFNGSTFFDALTLNTSGNLALGGTTASSVISGTATVLQISNGNLAAIALNQTGAKKYSISSQGNSSLVFYDETASAERARFNSTGAFLVGCTAVPINGVDGAWISAPTAGSGVLLGASSTSTTQMIRFYNNNGNVGGISISGSLTTYAVSSDYRLKENIVPLTGGLTKILQVKPSVYNYKADPSTQIEGFIAHELQEIVPHAVTGQKDGLDKDGNPEYQGVDASFLIPHLVAAVQELAAKVTALETK